MQSLKKVTDRATDVPLNETASATDENDNQLTIVTDMSEGIENNKSSTFIHLLL